MERPIIESDFQQNIDYTYFYSDGRIDSQYEKNSLYLEGALVDSFTTKTFFTYNTKGALVEESTLTDAAEKPFRKLYFYNASDSLVEEMQINPENDTFLWQAYDYYPDGRKTIFSRMIMNQNIGNPSATPVNDTTFSRFTHHFEGDKHHKTVEHDLRGQVISNIFYTYKNGKLDQARHYSLQAGMELLEHIVYYDYSQSPTQPNTYSITSNNDTLEFVVHTFKENELLKTISAYNYGGMIQEERYENGKLVKLLAINAHEPENDHLMLFEYNHKGDLKRSEVYKGVVIKR